MKSNKKVKKGSGSKNAKTSTKKKDNKERFKILTPTFRVSHPHLFEAKAFQKGGTKYYSIEMLFDKTKFKLSTLKDKVVLAANEHWGEGNWPTGFRKPYFDGDKPNPSNGEMKPEHKGMWVFKASSSAEYQPPHVVGIDKKGKLVEDIEPGDLYPGCYARAQLMACAYETGPNKGVKFILDGVQKVADGKAIGGKKSASEMFGRLEVEDGDDQYEDDEDYDDADEDDSDTDDEDVDDEDDYEDDEDDSDDEDEDDED